MTDLIWVITSCVLIAAVIAVRAIFGKKMSAGLRYALWGLVLIRLLVPGTVFTSPVSVTSAVQEAPVVRDLDAVSAVNAIAQTETGAVIGQLRRPEAVQAPDQGQTSAEPVQHQTGVKPAPQTAVILQEATPERYRQLKKTLEARDILNIIWYTGMALAAAYFIAANIRFYLKLRARRVRLDIDAPCRVYSVEGLNSSCLFLNTVYISKDNAEDEEKLRYVLAHELSHRRHGDGAFALLRTAALIIHWYNPLVWAAAFISRRDSELFADAGAIKALGGDCREDYGRTLIELSSRPSVYAPIACAATMMTGGKRELRSRITHIARDRKMSFIIAAVVLTLALAAVGCTFMGGKADTGVPETAPTEQPEQTAEPTEAPTEEPIGDADSQKQAAIDIARSIAEGVCREHGVTVDLDNGSIKKSHSGDYVVTFSKLAEGTDNAEAVINMVFDGDLTDPKIKSCTFEDITPLDVDPDKLEKDLKAIDVISRGKTEETDNTFLSTDGSGTRPDLSSSGSSLVIEVSGNAADSIAEKYAEALAAMFRTSGSDNYFHCTEAEVVRLEKVGGDGSDYGRYTVTVAMRPVNDAVFQMGTRSLESGLWNAIPQALCYYPQDYVDAHHEFDYCYAIKYVMQVKKTEDGSAFSIDYGYTWESFEE